MVNERVVNAFKATRALGIPDEEVKPVLKNLLKLFDKNWEPIEAEDYRTLLDAYFDSKENKILEGQKESLVKDGESEKPPEKQQVEEQEDQASSTMCNPQQVITTEEEDGTFITNSEMEISQLRQKHSGILISDQRMAPKDRISVFRRASCPGSSKQPIVECVSSPFQIKDAPTNHHGRDCNKQTAGKSTTRSAKFADFTAVIHPIPGNNFTSHLVPQWDVSGSGSNVNTLCESNFAVASSTLEEVKLLLNCDSAVNKPNFQIPDFNVVLKVLEDKYQRIDKIVTPRFSVMALLKDLCESYLELGTVSFNRSVADNSVTVRKNANSCNSLGSNKRNHRTSNSDVVMKHKVSKVLRFSDSGTATCNEKKSFRKLTDITKGAENIKISLVDEVGAEELPKFRYMTQNIIYQNAYMQISLSRIADEDCCSSCLGDCLSSKIPCACARETGGEFAYTQQGLLKQDFLRACESMKRNPQKHHFVFCQDCPLERFKNEFMPEKCTGHLVRKFIKECWRKCGCDMNCGNRVVQRGITCNLQVFMTAEAKGWGLRTLENLPKGTFICEYIGEILTNMELYDRNMLNSGSDRHTYPVTLDADWGSEKVLRDEEALCLDATFSGNVGRFINHRCEDANLIDIPVEIETPDRHYYHLAFFTTKQVNALEELTWDYGIDFDDHDHPVKAFRCCCGSALCRDVKEKRRRNSAAS